MFNKIPTTLAGFATVLTMVAFLLPSQALALTVIIDSDGMIEIFAGSVLGERTSFGQETAATNRARSADVNNNNQGSINNQANRAVEPTAQPTTTQTSPQPPIERINPSTTKRIEFSKEGDVTKMEVVKAEAGDRVELSEPTLTTDNRQRFETNQLEAKLPARYQIDPSEIENMPEPVREVVRDRIEREGESLRLESHETPQLISREVRSSLPGATISFDPATNSLWVTTPSGVERELTHLPDQALERMRALRPLTGEAELEIITVEDRVLYRVPNQAQRRVLGLFRRTVPTEVLLDDQTGEVGERSLPSPSLFGQFLDFISI